MYGGMVFGQYLPGKSTIHCLDPRAKLISTVLLGAAVFLSGSWLEIFSITLWVLMIIYLTKISPVLILKTWRVFWVFLGLLLLLQVIFIPGEVIYEYGILKITKEGLTQGGQIFFRLALIMVLASVFTFTTSPVSITGSIEIIFAPLKKFKFPVHEMAMMITIAIRFLPTLFRDTNKIIAAQRSRGAPFNRKDIFRIDKFIIPVIVPLFVRVFQRADDLATAMEVRCYNGGDRRTRFKEFRYTKKDFAAIIISILIFLYAGLM
ncbi:energy-coupling factor transporter transmembrane component T family protein [Desulfolucanica intricata]|uniref:energy-coupling factor transporter transmembrane component T family protein n=1 Tax=Desulfolucanica intricata TaxID=1285191 RepID=UPI000835A068|nr:energy-coupling factor transporter transmembrane component T [Desulfolucanica intricata]